MKLQATVPIAILATLGAAQTLSIPSRVGSIVSLSSPSPISGVKGMGNKEYDLDVPATLMAMPEVKLSSSLKVTPLCLTSSLVPIIWKAFTAKGLHNYSRRYFFIS
jgi:hypothetical protein